MGDPDRLGRRQRPTGGRSQRRKKDDSNSSCSCCGGRGSWNGAVSGKKAALSSQAPAHALGSMKTPPDIGSGCAGWNRDPATAAWSLRMIFAIFSRNMGPCNSDPGGTPVPPKMPGPRPCTGEQKAVVSTPATSYHGRALTLAWLLGLRDHDILDRRPSLRGRSDDGAIQTESDPFGSARSRLPCNQREPWFGRPPLQRSGGYVGTETAQMFGVGAENVSSPQLAGIVQLWRTSVNSIVGNGPPAMRRLDP